MAQGEFTKQEAKETRISFDEIFAALSKNKQMSLFGNANDIYLFLSAAERNAPEEVPKESKG